MDNKLKDIEKKLLLLYRELLQKEYDCEEPNKHITHCEMQRVVYLTNQLLCDNDYDFEFIGYLYSEKLANDLKKLDIKTEKIKNYYLNLSDEIYDKSTRNELRKFYSLKEIDILEQFSKLISHIIERKEGLIILSNLAIIAHCGIQMNSFKEVNERFKRDYPFCNDDSYNEYCWYILEYFNTVPKTIETSKRKVKRIEY